MTTNTVSGKLVFGVFADTIYIIATNNNIACFYSWLEKWVNSVEVTITIL